MHDIITQLSLVKVLTQLFYPIEIIRSIILTLYFSKDVIKFGFKNYHNSSFNQLCRYFVVPFHRIEKKNTYLIKELKYYCIEPMLS